MKLPKTEEIQLTKAWQRIEAQRPTFSSGEKPGGDLPAYIFILRGQCLQGRMVPALASSCCVLGREAQDQPFQPSAASLKKAGQIWWRSCAFPIRDIDMAGCRLRVPSLQSLRITTNDCEIGICHDSPHLTGEGCSGTCGWHIAGKRVQSLLAGTNLLLKTRGSYFHFHFHKQQIGPASRQSNCPHISLRACFLKKRYKLFKYAN